MRRENRRTPIVNPFHPPIRPSIHPHAQDQVLILHLVLAAHHDTRDALLFAPARTVFESVQLQRSQRTHSGHVDAGMLMVHSTPRRDATGRYWTPYDASVKHWTLWDATENHGKPSSNPHLANGQAEQDGLSLDPLLTPKCASPNKQQANRGVSTSVERLEPSVRNTRLGHSENALKHPAHDISLLSHKLDDAQKKLCRVAEEAEKTGLQINISKTEVMRVNSKQQNPIRLHEEDIKEANKFTYLGSIVNKDGGSDEDIKCRINKARQAFITLRQIWKSKTLSIHNL
ncbi:hypothetical protein EGW08_010343 [Elysia chlorotica]|uniref:Reverse transcriptase domain-containing protein n=1 Tax=Elysia chlorotica TaxID=188477 RepID=A0A3S0ZLP7_ELYCH|nr:hypothetical protein EGW08_010343 [Elysia chlorotica]